MARLTEKSQKLLEHDAILWLLAIVLVTAVPHTSHLPVWLTLFGMAVLLWRIWLWQNQAPLPPRWIPGLLAMIGTAGIAWEYRTLFGRDSGVALLFFFMALKPMEMRNRRDALVVVMLGYFLLLTHYFFSQNIPTGLWLLCAATILTATLIRLHGGAQPIKPLLRHAGLLLLQAVPFMLILFLLFPRIQGPLWGLPRDAHSGLTGLSDQMSPGSLNNLIQSGEIAFRVQFSGEIPQKNQLYWRGPVLADYDGQIWRARLFFQRTDNASPLTSVERNGPLIRYAVTLEPHNRRWLLALDLPVDLPKNSTLTPHFETRARDPITQRTRLDLSSVVDFTANRIESPFILQAALHLPAGINPQTHALATSWRAKFDSPEKLSAEALQLFQQEKFFYTLQPPLLGPHAIDDFLFGTRRGFCEHFAAAYVVIMRAAGVPARVVTGYLGGEINPVDNYFTVRQSDAHAWAEIWIAGKGWLRVDPTAMVAPSRIEQGISAALPSSDPLPVLIRLDADWLRHLKFRWEAANNAWNQWVLEYDPQRQREILSRLGFREPDWRSMTAALTLLCGITLLATMFWTLIQRRRRTPAQRLWQLYCNRLESQGIEQAPWEGPMAFAERIATKNVKLGVLTRQAAGYYAELHYGTGGPEQLKQLKSCLNQLDRSLA